MFSEHLPTQNKNMSRDEDSSSALDGSSPVLIRVDESRQQLGLQMRERQTAETIVMTALDALGVQLWEVGILAHSTLLCTSQVR